MGEPGYPATALTGDWRASMACLGTDLTGSQCSKLTGDWHASVACLRAGWVRITMHASLLAVVVVPRPDAVHPQLNYINSCSTMGIVQGSSACCVRPGVPPARCWRIVAVPEPPTFWAGRAGGARSQGHTGPGHSGASLVFWARRRRALPGAYQTWSQRCVAQVWRRGDDARACHDVYATRFDMTDVFSHARLYSRALPFLCSSIAAARYWLGHVTRSGEGGKAREPGAIGWLTIVVERGIMAMDGIMRQDKARPRISAC